MAMLRTVGRCESKAADTVVWLVLALPAGSLNALLPTVTVTLPVTSVLGVRSAVYSSPLLPALSAGVLMTPLVTVMSLALNVSPGASVKVKVRVVVCPNLMVSGRPEMLTVGAVRSTSKAARV